MPKDMAGGRIDLSTIARIDRDTAERLSNHLLSAGDIVLSRRGDVGRTAWVSEHDLPVLCGTGSMRIHPGQGGPAHHAYLRYFMRSRVAIDYLEGQAVGATMPNLNAGIVAGLPVTLPPLEQQTVVAEVLTGIDDLIENNGRRSELLGRMAQAIYREWFVCFRYPGHEDVVLVDSTLGPIPKDWGVRRVAAIAGAERNAVTGGPFGSKLGRKDYVDTGVPVLRGANLRVGGGFDETDLVFVSEAKAAELRGSLAKRGDIIVTQRGTLGQVGLISPRSRFGRYLLSQSQMKITVDGAKATAEFIYAQFRTLETTGRFIAQAMSSGVPHVNLALLREFEILLPPLAIQAAFTEVLAPLSFQELHLSEQRRVLTSMRDLLLPRLVTGQIDVSELDLDALVDSVA